MRLQILCASVFNRPVTIPQLHTYPLSGAHHISGRRTVRWGRMLRALRASRGRFAGRSLGVAPSAPFVRRRTHGFLLLLWWFKRHPSLRRSPSSWASREAPGGLWELLRLDVEGEPAHNGSKKQRTGAYA